MQIIIVFKENIISGLWIGSSDEKYDRKKLWKISPNSHHILILLYVVLDDSGPWIPPVFSQCSSCRMVNFDCQLDWLERCLENWQSTVLGVSVKGISRDGWHVG